MKLAVIRTAFETAGVTFTNGDEPRGEAQAPARVKLPTQPAPAPITPEQLRNARELLGWSRDRLAVQSETTAGFIAEFEIKGQIGTFLWHPYGFNALDAIRGALEAGGIEFTNGDEPGVELKRQPK